jgi:hypothetical protein
LLPAKPDCLADYARVFRSGDVIQRILNRKILSPLFRDIFWQASLQEPGNSTFDITGGGLECDASPVVRREWSRGSRPDFKFTGEGFIRDFEIFLGEGKVALIQVISDRVVIPDRSGDSSESRA